MSSPSKLIPRSIGRLRSLVANNALRTSSPATTAVANTAKPLTTLQDVSANTPNAPDIWFNPSFPRRDPNSPLSYSDPKDKKSPADPRHAKLGKSTPYPTPSHLFKADRHIQPSASSKTASQPSSNNPSLKKSSLKTSPSTSSPQPTRTSPPSPAASPT